MFHLQVLNERESEINKRMENVCRTCESQKIKTCCLDDDDDDDDDHDDDEDDEVDDNVLGWAQEN